MILAICTAILIIGTITVFIGFKYDQVENVCGFGIMIICFTLVFGFGLLGLCLPIKSIKDTEYIIPVSVCKTNFETIVTYKINDQVEVVSSKDANFYCTTNDIIIIPTKYYNSYEIFINTSYEINLKP